MAVSIRSTGILLCSLWIGCAFFGPTASAPDHPAAQATRLSTEAQRRVTRLRPPSALERGILLRQRVTARWEERGESFEAVVQNRGDALTVVGLGPMAMRGFTLVLDTRGVSVENRTGRDLPFVAEHILADIQRVFYPWFEAPPACDACGRQTTYGGLIVHEQIDANVLRERRFAIAGEPDAGEVAIRYGDWWPDPLIPKHVVVENDWFGYELTIETTSVQRIDP